MIRLMFVYVDIVLRGCNKRFIEEFIKQLSVEFALKDLGKLRYFLGLKIKCSSKYAKDFLSRARML